MDFIAQLPTVILGWITSVFGEHPSWDVLLYMALIVLAVVAGAWGRARLVSTLIASYIVVALLGLTDTLGWIQGGLGIPDTIWGTSGVIVGLVAVLFAIVHYGLGGVLDDEDGSMVTSVILALSVLGMLVAFIFSRLDITTLNGFSSFSKSVFAGQVSLAIWILAPIITVGATRD